MPITEPVSSNNKDIQPLNPLARFLGTGSVALAETILFHPLDTVSKRLMNNPGKLSFNLMRSNYPQFTETFNRIIFNDTTGIKQRSLSLVPGLKWALNYKVLERVHAFALQPLVASALSNKFGAGYNNVFGAKNSNIMVQGTAGAFLGGTQVLYIPLDALRTQAQLGTLPKNKNFIELIKGLGVSKLYNGSSYYVSRTAGSAFSLFAVSAATKQYLFKLDDPKKATLGQNTAANTVGAITSVVLTNPLDIIKTRIQAQKGKVSGVDVVKKILKEEGVSAVTKGLIPKTGSVVPKLVMTMTMAPYMSQYLNKFFVNQSPLLKEEQSIIKQDKDLQKQKFA